MAQRDEVEETTDIASIGHDAQAIFEDFGDTIVVYHFLVLNVVVEN